jgi:hypothetical protein
MNKGTFPNESIRRNKVQERESILVIIAYIWGGFYRIYSIDDINLSKGILTVFNCLIPYVFYGFKLFFS